MQVATLDPKEGGAQVWAKSVPRSQKVWVTLATVTGLGPWSNTAVALAAGTPALP